MSVLRSSVTTAALAFIAWLGSHRATWAEPAAKIWLETSLRRVYPNSPAGAMKNLRLITASNRTVSFQAVVRNESTERLGVERGVDAGADLQARVRRVGYVPLRHLTPEVPSRKASINRPWKNV